MTIVDQAAVEALLSLPFANPHGGLVLNEFRLGKTSIREKMLTAFRRTTDTRELICFIGDLAGELDGHMALEFWAPHDLTDTFCYALFKFSYCTGPM